MDKKNELMNILRAELTLLTKDILQNIHQKDVAELYTATQSLFEKMAAIKALSKQLEASEVLDIVNLENKKIVEKESNLSQEDKQQTTAFDKSVKPAANPYKELQNLSFTPKSNKQENENLTEVKIPKTTTAIKKMSIGLNDRIAFVKNLFEGDEQAFAETIEKLNAFERYEDALSFIYKSVKPKYNQWKNKDEYEFRLIQLLELKFA